MRRNVNHPKTQKLHWICLTVWGIPSEPLNAHSPQGDGGIAEKILDCRTSPLPRMMHF